MRTLWVLAFAISTPALAQTTECRTLFGTTTCQTTQPPKGIDWSTLGPGFDASQSMRAYENARRSRDAANQRAREADIQQQQEIERQQDMADKQRSAELRQHVGRLVAAKQCENAETAALEAGDFELAETVKSYCR